MPLIGSSGRRSSQRSRGYRCQDGGAGVAGGVDGTLEERLQSATLAAELPSSPLASFPAIFRTALALGVLSRRRVLQLAEERQVRPGLGLG